MEPLGFRFSIWSGHSPSCDRTFRPGNSSCGIFTRSRLEEELTLRDYLISTPIRIFLFDNRIEIISPGSLPNNLTVEKIRNGNSNIRNPILVSFIAKGLLPYRGLGSGIKRALEDWPDIDFTDDRDGCLFTAPIHRKKWKSSEESHKEGEGSEKSSVKCSEKIISLMKKEPGLSTKEIANWFELTSRAIKKQIAALKKNGKFKESARYLGGRINALRSRMG